MRDDESAAEVEVEYLNTAGIAERFGLSAATLETWRVRGGGPPYTKLGRRVLYRVGTVERWMLARQRTSTSDTGQAA